MESAALVKNNQVSHGRYSHSTDQCIDEKIVPFTGKSTYQKYNTPNWVNYIHTAWHRHRVEFGISKKLSELLQMKCRKNRRVKLLYCNFIPKLPNTAQSIWTAFSLESELLKHC